MVLSNIFSKEFSYIFPPGYLENFNYFFALDVHQTKYFDLLEIQSRPVQNHVALDHH
jgi:hypothetical protein